MRVISIKEPYVSLIMHKYKQIKTRSWKTNYRGEIHIHASKSAVTNELLNDEVKRLTSSITLNHGHIIYEEHINNPFPNGKSLKDVEKRMQVLLNI